MASTSRNFLGWLASLTLILRCFVIALIFHAALIFVVASIKIGGIAVKAFTAAFESASPPPAAEEEPNPFAAYREVDYNPPGASGPQLPTEYKVAIAQTPPQETDTKAAEVIGVLSETATAVARLQGAPGALATPTFGGGGGEGKIGIPGGTGNGNFLQRLDGTRRTIARDKYKGSQKAELAVLAALRWLKANQNDDGSWSMDQRPAMTALAVLSFLGHGDTPDSVEFGDSVNRGIQFLLRTVDQTGLVTPRNMYAQGAVTLALAEAYGMTQAKPIRETLERAVKANVKAQKVAKKNDAHTGGWRYSSTAPDSDLSVSGWIIMSLKSAKLAGLDVPEESFAAAGKYVWAMYDDDGGFGYSAPKRSANMTGAGVLCQQFLGQGTDPRLKRALDFLKTQKVVWAEASGHYVLYGWYYITQAMFQGGGAYWEYWNKQIRDTIINAQSQDGHWEAPPKSGEKKHGFTYTTTLCCLMLEVYYRYLPLYQELEKRPAAAAPDAN